MQSAHLFLVLLQYTCWVLLPFTEFTVMSDIITFIRYRQCIFMSGLSLCAEGTFFSGIFAVQILVLLLHFTESIVMSDIITF